MSKISFQIFLGSLFILVTGAIILIYGFNEEKRMTEQSAAMHGRAIEQGAALFEQQCSRCHGVQGTGIPGLCPPLNDRNFFDSRLQEVNWSGSMEDYIVATVASGRLSSTRPQTFPGQGTPAMPSFSDRFGGPLREDQIRYLAAFIMNWEKTAEAVSAPEPLSEPAPGAKIVGTDITQTLPPGDAAAGEKLTSTLGCVACHIASSVGPAWLPSGSQPGIGDQAAQLFKEPGYTGHAKTPEQYLFESIVDPNVFVVSGFSSGLMPGNYATSLTDQNVADLIAYLLTLK